jgi:hypothetical protein
VADADKAEFDMNEGEASRRSAEEANDSEE